MTDNMELVVDVTDINAPALIGAVGGLAQSVCGVYAMPTRASTMLPPRPDGSRQ